jgi:hypothetical protein
MFAFMFVVLGSVLLGEEGCDVVHPPWYFGAARGEQGSDPEGDRGEVGVFINQPKKKEKRKTMRTVINEVASSAKKAFDELQSIDDQNKKTEGLERLKRALVERKEEILRANDLDVQVRNVIRRNNKTKKKEWIATISLKPDTHDAQITNQLITRT